MRDRRHACRTWPSLARLEALGHEVVLCPLIEIEPLGDDADRRVGLRLARRDEPERRGRARPPAGVTAAPARGDRAGDRGRAAAHGLRADLVAARARRRRACATSSRPRPASCSPPRRARGAPRRRSAPTSLPLYRTVELRPARLPEATSPCSPRPRPRGRSRRRARGCPSSRSGPQTAAAARDGRARRRRPRRETHDLDGLVAAVGSRDVSRLPGCRVHHLPHRLRAAGRLRRHLPRRDQADRARDADHRHHARHPPGPVLQGALVLANTLPYMPAGVHLAVVDPGVGGVRRPLALRDARGPAVRRPRQRPAASGRRPVRRHRRGARARQPRLRARAASRAPSTAATSSRRRRRTSPRRAARRARPADRPRGARAARASRSRSSAPASIRATVLDVDRFGNVALNLTRDQLERASIVPGHAGRARRSRGERYFAVAARTFGDARAGRRSSCTRTATGTSRWPCRAAARPSCSASKREATS